MILAIEDFREVFVYVMESENHCEIADKAQIELRFKLQISHTLKYFIPCAFS